MNFLSSRIALLAFSTLACFGGGFADAQELDFPDPTIESPEIRSQLEAVRGVKELSQLQQRIENLEAENAKLLEQLEAMLMSSRKLESELESLRADREANERRRLAIPDIRLVAQVRTLAISRAEIEAGGRLYRINSDTDFVLQLSNGQGVRASARFLPMGEVEVVIPELETVHRLTFRPTPAS